MLEREREHFPYVVDTFSRYKQCCGSVILVRILVFSSVTSKM